MFTYRTNESDKENSYFTIGWARNNKQAKGVGNEENRSIRGGDCYF